MTGLLALDQHATTDRLRDTRQHVAADGDWSPRRRLMSLIACVVASWLLVLVPLLILS